MKNFIIVSKCLRVTKINTETDWYEFHFKGVFAGKFVRKIVLYSPSFAINIGVEYLIYAQPIAFEDNVLRGNVIKLKTLEECWDKS